MAVALLYRFTFGCAHQHHSPSATTDPPPQSRPSAFQVFCAAFVLLYLFVFDCIYQHRPLAAYGFAAIAAASVIVTPQLIFNSVTQHPSITQLRRELSWRCRVIAKRCLIAGAVMTVAPAIAVKLHWFQPLYLPELILVAGACLFLLGAVFFVLFLTLGGESGKPLAATNGTASLRSLSQDIDSTNWLWLLAGVLFFAGTVIQFFTT